MPSDATERAAPTRRPIPAHATHNQMEDGITLPHEASRGKGERHDPMARPTPADLLILADIAEVLDDPGLAALWRRQARKAMRPASLRAEVEADQVTGCALHADLSAQFGSLAKVYDFLGPDPAPAPVDGGDEVAMCEPPGDPRRWTR